MIILGIIYLACAAIFLEMADRAPVIDSQASDLPTSTGT